MTYKHGAYGEQVPTQDALPPSGVATLPVYIGTSPVDTLTDSSGAINKPILVNSFEDAKAKLGYSDDWEQYTLCEAMYAHFKNRIGSIGPVVFINVFNPAVHDEETPVSNTDIIGGIDENGKRTGIECIDLIYQTYNMIPTILASPGWGHDKTVKEALIAKSKKINGHWDALVAADIDCSITGAKTIDAAKTWKTTNLYNDTNLKVFWPKVKLGELEFWMSTMAIVRMQQTDYVNGNVPYESPSNKPVDITGTILADGTPIEFDEVQANDLNSVGITTVTYRGGNWVLWGPHNGNFEDGKDIDIRDKFDAGIRMMMFVTNSFQEMYMVDVDSPLNRSKIDTILNDAQTWLNSLVTDGKLLYAQIAFNETSNPVASIVEGDFVFDVRTTTTPPGKSLTFKVQYTTQGINTLFGGEIA